MVLKIEKDKFESVTDERGVLGVSGHCGGAEPTGITV